MSLADVRKYSMADVLSDGVTAAFLADPKSARLYMFGIYFGFPECCIRQFITEFDTVVRGKSTPTRRPPHGMSTADAQAANWPWCGTGFIPCDECAPVARADFPKFVCERIALNRLCKTAFPNGDGDQFAKELSL